LFDSKAVQKLPLENPPCSKLKFGSRQKSDNKSTGTYVEVTNGFGYQVGSIYTSLLCPIMINLSWNTWRMQWFI